jgi:hypothetical protein
VIAGGVRPYHVEIAWHDGSGWVVNRGGANDVTLGGRPVASEWQRVEVPARLEFGSAVLQMRASVGPAPVGDFESTRVVFEGMDQLEEPRTSEPDTAPSASGPVEGAAEVRAPSPPSARKSEPQPVLRLRFILLSAVVVGVVGGGFLLLKLTQAASSGTSRDPTSDAQHEPVSSSFELPEPTVTAYEPATDPELAALEARALQAYALGQLGDATALYEELAGRRPEHRGFAVALEVLRERCIHGGRECARTPAP